MDDYLNILNPEVFPDKFPKPIWGMIMNRADSEALRLWSCTGRYLYHLCNTDLRRALRVDLLHVERIHQIAKCWAFEKELRNIALETVSLDHRRVKGLGFGADRRIIAIQKSAGFLFVEYEVKHHGSAIALLHPILKCRWELGPIFRACAIPMELSSDYPVWRHQNATYTGGDLSSSRVDCTVLQLPGVTELRFVVRRGKSVVQCRIMAGDSDVNDSEEPRLKRQKTIPIVSEDW